MRAILRQSRTAVRFVYGFRHLISRIKDACHYVANPGQTALPPPSLRTIGGGDFHRIGVCNIRHIRKFTPLDGKRVLEIGCGSGRNALAMLTYDVRYDGIDIYKPYIDWCAANIAGTTFRFHHADLYNGIYNPRGRASPDAFTFPFPDTSFDLIVLTSVFTHMMESDAIHYLHEIARMLAPGGALYATFFLLNDEARVHISDGKSTFAFNSCGREGHAFAEAAIAFEESKIRTILQELGFAAPQIAFGSWCGRPNNFDFQDVIFVERLQ